MSFSNFSTGLVHRLAYYSCAFTQQTTNWADSVHVWLALGLDSMDRIDCIVPEIEYALAMDDVRVEPSFASMKRTNEIN